VEAELSAKEKAIPRRLKLKLMREAFPYSRVAGRQGILPGFGPQRNFPLESQISISVNAGKPKAVCGKIVRGLEYYLEGSYVEPPYVLDVFFIDEMAADRIAMAFGPPQIHLGPGFEVRRRAARDDPKHVLYRVKVWGDAPCSCRDHNSAAIRVVTHSHE